MNKFETYYIEELIEYVQDLMDDDDTYCEVIECSEKAKKQLEQIKPLVGIVNDMNQQLNDLEK